MNALLNASRTALAAALAIAIGSLFITARSGVETDLYGLVDSSHKEILSALANSVGGQARILVEADSSEVAISTARKFASANPGYLMSGGEVAPAIAELISHRAGLLSEETREKLLAKNYDAVARSAYRTLTTGFITPFVSVRDDPFLLTTDYLMSFMSRDTAGWTLRDGFPSCDRDGRFYTLLSYNLSSLPQSRLSAAVHTLISAAKNETSADAAIKLYCSGAPFHTVLATESSKREINILSAISLVLVFILGIILFRGVRFFLPLVSALAAGFVVATATLFAAFGRPHILTFVFGTSLIGLSVDYSYHYFMALRSASVDSKECVGNVACRKILRSLSFSLLTTVVCFVPLLLSTVSVLRQMAVFTTAGLITVFSVVVLMYPLFGDMPCGRSSTSQKKATMVSHRYGALAIPLMAGLSLCCGIGIFRLHFGNDMSRFYRPDKFLFEGERKFVELNRVAASSFTLVKGNTIEEALQREEDLGIEGVSAIFPSVRRQKENVILSEKLVEAKGAWLASYCGIGCRSNKVDHAQDDIKFLSPENVTSPLLTQLISTAIIRTKDAVYTVFPGDAHVKSPYVSVFDPKSALIELFDEYARETYRLFGISLAVLTVVLVILFRRRFFSYVLPTALATVSTLGVLGWCGETINFFHALCLFVLVGLGLDYTIFHLGNNEPSTKKAVFFSFMTSFVGLGALSFTSFAVTRSIGATLALGLLFSYFYSRLVSARNNMISDKHEKKEETITRK